MINEKFSLSTYHFSLIYLSFLLVSVFTKSLFSFVRRDFMTLPFFTTRHILQILLMKKLLCQTVVLKNERKSKKKI